MAKEWCGILALCMMITVILTGLYDISLYSATAAGIYLAGCIVSLIAFVYLYCTKCPIRKQCIHVVMGLLTRVMPDRPAEPYTRWEHVGVFTFYGFVLLFPQYWLIREPVLIVVFWLLFIGNITLTHYTCCKGCGNTYCKFRHGES